MGQVCPTQEEPNGAMLTTEDLHSIPHFTGDNTDIRPLLDYTWHKKYNAQREQVQDRIINTLSGKALTQDSEMLPWVVFTAGAMGVGKGYVTEWMNANGYMKLEDFVLVDPDSIRELLPEWSVFVAEDAETAGQRTQKEAGCIAEILGYRALRLRRSVIFDGSLRDVAWYTRYFEKLRQQFPGVRIMILHVVGTEREILDRAEARGKKTGRKVPKEQLLASMQTVPNSVCELAPHSDLVVRVRNSSGQEPTLEHQLGAPRPPESCKLSWSLVKRVWEPLDVDGDGHLSKEEVDIALATGLVTPEVIAKVDTNHDGAISKEELRALKAMAWMSGSKSLR